LFKILKHSIAMVRILLTFRDGTLAFSNHHMCSHSSRI
jgi:hypothetical protein